MATSLHLVFQGEDKKISITFPHANANADPADVKTLMQEIIAQNVIYVDPPKSMVSADFITTATTPVNLRA